jgi:hypothetical protein
LSPQPEPVQHGQGGLRWSRRERQAGRRRVAVRESLSRRCAPGLGAPDTRPRGHKWPRWGHTDQWPEAHARQWSELFPVFPVDSGLFPVLPGTEKPNHINDLRLIFGFVPGVPGKSWRHPEGCRAEGTPPPGVVGVYSAAVAGKLPAGPWGVALRVPVLGPSAWFGGTGTNRARERPSVA